MFERSWKGTLSATDFGPLECCTLLNRLPWRLDGLWVARGTSHCSDQLCRLEGFDERHTSATSGSLANTLLHELKFRLGV